ARKTDGVDPEGCQLLRSPEGTVAADDHQTVDAVLVADLCRFLLILLLHKLQTSGCLQNRAALLNNLGDTVSIHINNLFLKKTCISSLDSLNFSPPCDRLTHNCPDGSIHSRGISAAG